MLLHESRRELLRLLLLSRVVVNLQHVQPAVAVGPQLVVMQLLPESSV
jgi:hypothetical protein